MSETVDIKDETEDPPKKKIKVDSAEEEIVKSHLFIGTKSGLIKDFHLKENKNILSHVRVPLNKEGQLSSINYIDPEFQTKILLGYENQFVQTFYVNEVLFDAPVPYIHDESVLMNAFYVDELLVTGLQSGLVVLYQGKKNKCVINTVTHTPPGDWDVGSARLSFVKSNPYDTEKIITGGCENNLKVWDLQTNKMTFKAKNVDKDMLHLRVPIDLSDATFLDQSSIVVATRNKEIRLYDIRNKPNPVLNYNFGDSPFTKIIKNPHSARTVLIGESYGKVSHVDIRRFKPNKPARSITQYKGYVGAVKDIAVHSKLPLMFTISLDRKLNMHNINTAKLVHSSYLKSMPKCLLLSRNMPEELIGWDI